MHRPYNPHQSWKYRRDAAYSGTAEGAEAEALQLAGPEFLWMQCFLRGHVRAERQEPAQVTHEYFGRNALACIGQRGRKLEGVHARRLKGTSASEQGASLQEPRPYLRPRCQPATGSSPEARDTPRLAGPPVFQAGHAPTGKGAIAEAAGRELGLDDQPLQDVLTLKSGQYTPDATALKRLYNAFMGTVQHAADMVDRR